ncbi:MAG: DUF4167 domain-containing protein, partial [Erythrobacter sp.]|nr:DUF4167 domain-containing protein [Erythrobacter sp.]
PQGGNGSQLNRIDSRARGNAPQMLDKFKKLAQDAQHNGDRVQMEYYLQFADHYFRVIADNKARQDEQRGGASGNPRRNDERDQAEDYSDDDLDFDRGRRSEQASRPRYEQQDAGARNDVEEGESGQEGEPFLSNDRNNDRGDDRGQQQRQPNTRRQPRKTSDDSRGERSERAPRAERAPRQERANRPERAEGARSEKPAEKSADTPADKPAPRVRKPRKAADDSRSVLDSSILPPSIRGDDTRDSSGDSDGTLEAVG